MQNVSLTRIIGLINKNVRNSMVRLKIRLKNSYSNVMKLITEYLPLMFLCLS